ncbi:2-hydroxy-3-oxopropionate reductase [Anaerotalea alkaliphila]|uniref:2-hydroxy-3-oxopropionate reductase n=1 Tax=Anaerotalea alkaliphila TaxID=2662126 RepID=A0A7X5HV86_9FIRM|nr:2-hydroxy-3-oxopropionate reductase [Anaerotalea alkaliphila]NDL67255.1 2-hydroxy-3-oxopropionate reductase [Anaerotalea alkaliphila]
MEKIGFIGLGIMGKPMAMNLHKAGVELLVYDVNPGVLEEFQDAGVASASLREIGEECKVIFTILPSGGIVQEVLFGEGGVGETVKPGTVVCDMSSVTPVESKTCAERLSVLGVGFVDSPVSGGEPKAIDGTLSFMAGGEEAHFNALKGYFEIMGASAILIGGSGSGSVTKLANQIIVNMTIAAVSEAFVLAAKAGADPVKVHQAIRGGLAGSVVMDAKIPMIVERNFKPGGKLSINHKDIKNVLATAHAIDVPVPLTSQLFEIMQALKVGGHMDEDHGGIVQYFEQLADVRVEKKPIR